MLLPTPALRARRVENQHATGKLFTEFLAARGEDAQEATHKRVLAAATLAALAVALSAGVQSDCAEQLPALVDRAFRALRHGLKNRPLNQR